jgi:hypothetical protein
LNVTAHPVIPIPSDDDLRYIHKQKGDKGVQELLRAREERIQLFEKDPINHGIRMPSWDLVFDQLDKWYEVIAYGGNGSAKSRLGAWITVQCLLHNPGHKIYCFAQDDHASVDIQQKYVYEHLPPKFKEKKISEKGYLKYTDKNGFTGGSFILDLEDGTEPRLCRFFKYSQYQANKAKFEGYEYGSRDPQPFTIPAQKIRLGDKVWNMPEKTITLNVGAWLDEYLENGELYNTLLYRIPRRGSSIFTSFTPIDHMTPFVADKIKKSRITKTIPTNPRVFHGPDDPKKVEWVREKKLSDNHKSGIGMVYMPSEHNPWAGFENMVSLHSHKTLEEKLVRFHGVPSNVLTCLFPLFNTTVHVTNQIPHMVTKSKNSQRITHTIYQVVDPAGNRNYSTFWAAVDRSGYITIIREWPDYNTYGPWAEFGDPKWHPGPASRKLGHDIQGYIDLFRNIEDELEVEVFERIGDSRYFARENENNIDLFESFGRKGMYFVPSSGQEIDTGLSALDEWFTYNPDLPVDEANRPILTIHSSCGNLIEALLNWSNQGKKDEALKDFVDLLRYLRLHNDGYGPDFVDQQGMITTVQGTGGY